VFSSPLFPPLPGIQNNLKVQVIGLLFPISFVRLAASKVTLCRLMPFVLFPPLSFLDADLFLFPLLFLHDHDFFPFSPRCIVGGSVLCYCSYVTQIRSFSFLLLLPSPLCGEQLLFLFFPFFFFVFVGQLQVELVSLPHEFLCLFPPMKHEKTHGDPLLFPLDRCVRQRNSHFLSGQHGGDISL